MKGLSWTNFALGLWLAVAPFVLLYNGTSAALWEDVILGFLIAVFALWRALGSETQDMTGVSWIVAVLGVWAVIAPFALGYAAIEAAVWNDVIIGIVVVVLGTVRALEKPLQSMGKMTEQHHGAH